MNNQTQAPSYGGVEAWIVPQYTKDGRLTPEGMIMLRWDNSFSSEALAKVKMIGDQIEVTLLFKRKASRKWQQEAENYFKPIILESFIRMFGDHEVPDAVRS